MLRVVWVGGRGQPGSLWNQLLMLWRLLVQNGLLL